MEKKPLAIVISENGSDTNWLGTARSLGKMGVPVIRLSPKSWYQSKYCSTVISPRISQEPQKYLEFLLTLGEQLSRRGAPRPFLMPASDNALILLSKNESELKEYFVSVVPNWNCVEKIIDKSKTYSAAKKLGIRVPETYTLEDLDSLNEIAETVSFPCLVKPAYSHIFTVKFKKKLYEVSSKEQLISTCEPLLVQGHKLLLQEKIVGSDDCIFDFSTCFNENSEPLTLFTQRKLRQHPPNFGIGSFGESVWEPRIIDPGLRLLKGIGFYGVAMVEFKKDARTGDYVLIEINGRSSTRMYLATACGLNIPYILYKDLMVEKQERVKNYECKYKVGIKWVHLKLDFLTMMKKRKMAEITVANWLRSLMIGKKVYGVFSLDDPAPFFSEVKGTFSKISDVFP